MQVAPLLVVLAFAGLVGWFILMVRRHALAAREKVNAVALTMGLRVIERKTGGFMTVEALEGEQGGRAIRYWTYTTGSGKSRVTWVAVGVRPKRHGALEFKLSRQGFGTKISEWFGAKEIKVGDRAFDDAWFIQTNQPDFFTAALVPDIRAKLATNPDNSGRGTYQLKDGIVQFTRPGFLVDEKVVRSLEQELPVLQDLADVAEVFAGTQA